MSHRLIPLAVLVALALGCGGKDKPGGDDNSGGAGGGGESSATYTITVRDEAEGDKVIVSRMTTATATDTSTRKGTTTKKDHKEHDRAEYTETVVSKPAGAPRPTKVTRAYKLAERTGPDGKVKTLSYQGKTVSIEQGGGGRYTARVNGTVLPPPEAGPLTAEFTRGAGQEVLTLLPTAPVKVGEAWAPDAEAVKKALTSAAFQADPEKSKITGRLTRAYTRDGKQWGVIEFRLDLVAGGPSVPKGGTGTITSVITLDALIDGSSREWTKRTKVQGTTKYVQGGVEGEVTFDATDEETVTPAK